MDPMVILLPLGVLALGVVIGFLSRLATRPVRTLVNTVRVLLFFVALALVVAYLSLRADLDDAARTEVIACIAALLGAWALTFLIPAIARAVLAARRDERERFRQY